MRPRLLSILAPLVLAFGFVHCQDGVGLDGDVVGGSCRDSRDCAERCVRGSDFPGGTCTVDCRDDRDCPASTYCIDVSGGICLLDCYDDRDCRRGYDCSNKRRRGTSGRAYVCIDD
jgi:hypothetical protein